MTLIAGIDPGASGAIAVYCTDTKRLITIEDMPVWYMTIGKNKRKRIDSVAVMEMFDQFNMVGVELVVMEAVGGRPRQGASAAFAFGYGVGILYMAAMYSKIMVETVPPSRWKKLMNVPGKLKAEKGDIMNRAEEMFPHDRAMLRGRNGGEKLDRAEAAMLAKFGGDTVWPTVPQRIPGDEEFKMAYRNAETGA